MDALMDAALPELRVRRQVLGGEEPRGEVAAGLHEHRRERLPRLDGRRGQRAQDAGVLALGDGELHVRAEVGREDVGPVAAGRGGGGADGADERALELGHLVLLPVHQHHDGRAHAAHEVLVLAVVDVRREGDGLDRALERLLLAPHVLHHLRVRQQLARQRPLLRVPRDHHAVLLRRAPTVREGRSFDEHGGVRDQSHPVLVLVPRTHRSKRCREGPLFRKPGEASTTAGCMSSSS